MYTPSLRLLAKISGTRKLNKMVKLEFSKILISKNFVGSD